MERVRDWMGQPLVAIDEGTMLEEAAQTMVDHGIRHLPVLRENGRCVGLLSDLTVFSVGNWLEGRWVQQRPGDASAFMEPVRAVVHPDDEVVLGLVALRDHQADCAVVLLDDGRPIGILTEHDVVRLGASWLTDEVRIPLGRPLAAVPPDIHISRALSAMLSWDVRHLLVVDGHHLAGVVSVRDLAIRPGSWSVRQAMPSAPIHLVDPSASMREVAETMRLHKVGAVVVMRGDRPVGIVTRTDVARALVFAAGAGEDTLPRERR